jgi:NAD(P)-dependent dehydrogenase (short-subunit alcohol dehydrogenase family)
MSNNHGQELAGKIAVITGGSSGIGLATAKRFVEEGAHVVITGRREKELKEAAAFIKTNVTTVVGDVSRLEDLDRLYAVVKEKHGHIDSSRTRARVQSHRSRWLLRPILTRPST